MGVVAGQTMLRALNLLGCVLVVRAPCLGNRKSHPGTEPPVAFLLGGESPKSS